MAGRSSIFSVVLNTALFVISLPTANANTIPPAYQRIAGEQGIPAEMLYAISLNESGKKLSSRNIKPWPWTLNVAGKSYFYDTRDEACTALQKFVKSHSLKRIDVGLAQVNIGWNGQHFFADHCDGFEPLENLRVASIILKQCYATHQNWINAAGCYHHPKGGAPAKRYKTGIRQKLASISTEKNSTSSAPVKLTNTNVQVQLPTPGKSIQAPEIAGIEINPDGSYGEIASHVNWISPGEQTMVWIEPTDNKESL